MSGEKAKTIRETRFQGFYFAYMVGMNGCESARKFRPSRPEA
ncbi:Uncharacterised protein [Klebsiella aerogenes]|nr:Uncharacterised protein [Klebsiella aerogenes]